MYKFITENGEKLSKISIKGEILETNFNNIIQLLKPSTIFKFVVLKIIKNGESEKIEANLENLELVTGEHYDGRLWHDRERTIPEFKIKVGSYATQFDIIKSLKCLKSLTIFDKLDLAEWKFCELFVNKNLESFETDMIKPINGCAAAIFTQNNLRELKFHNFRLNDELFMQMIESLPNLTTLEVSLRKIDHKLIHKLENLKNLQNFEAKVRYHNQIEAISRMNLINLKKLKIHHHRMTVDAKVIENLALNFPNLSFIGFCGSLFANIVNIFTHFNRVEFLHLQDESKFKLFRDDRFFTHSHPNDKLKKIVFFVESIRLLEVIAKFKRDFKNLEKFRTSQLHSISGCWDLQCLPYENPEADTEDEDKYLIEPFVPVFEYHSHRNRNAEGRDAQSDNLDDLNVFNFKACEFKEEMNDMLKDDGIEKFVTFDMVSKSRKFVYIF